MGKSRSTPTRGRLIRRASRWDILAAFALAVAAAWGIDRISAGFPYRWEWEALPQYFLRRDPESGRLAANVLLLGFLTTIRLSLWAMLLATLIGFAAALLRMSRRAFRRAAAAAYVELFRNSPPIVLVFVFYYFIGEQLFSGWGLLEAPVARDGSAAALLELLFAPAGLRIPFLSAVLTLALFEGAYITEIIRAGIQAIDPGQYEAATAQGFSRWQRLRYILWPQALRRILPPLGGQFISTIKDSAIVSVISIPELTFRGLELMSATHLTIETWITITGLYFLLTFGCSLVFAALERASHRRPA
ncbi:MAG: amino acid ABC transporter permease [Desulfobacterales bacterium]